jgi:predicted molibdopterin-dependent oxidoreductase YjgC
MAKSYARLEHPLVRDGDRATGTLRRATWDEALDRAAAGIRRSIDAKGPTSIGLFSCSKATNELNFITGKFMRQVVGSNNIDSCNRT